MARLPLEKAVSPESSPGDWDLFTSILAPFIGQSPGKSCKRKFVEKKLHEQAQSQDLIVEGRDIGSVVFPDTPYKFYIDASPEVRLQRRAAQGERDEITIRDRDDVSRAVSPLVIAEDAHVIDTSHLTIQEVINEIVSVLEKIGLRT